jgi:hypothetical protein
MTLPDHQMHLIREAASLLPGYARDDFWRSVANRLTDLPDKPTDADIHRALTLVLSGHGISRGDSHGHSIRRRRSV